MFSSNSFGQSSSSSPFGSQSAFGQPSNAYNLFAPKPFGSTTPFGAQTGGSIFGGTSTGVFETTQPPSLFSFTPAVGASSSSTFSISVPAFGATSTSVGSTSSAFGGSSLFGSTNQPSQPTFGSNIFGSFSVFGASSQPGFGSASTPAFGSTSTPAFGATAPAFGGTGSAFGVTSTTAFGSTATSAFGRTGSAFGASTGGAFGASSTHPFGSTTTNAFDASSTPLSGAVGTPAFGASSTPAFDATSTPDFGASSMPAFGASSTPSISFGSSPAFGQSTAAIEEDNATVFKDDGPKVQSDLVADLLADLEEDPQASLVARPRLPSPEPLPDDSIELLVYAGSAESGEELTATSQPQPALLPLTILEESSQLQIIKSPPGSKQEFEQRAPEDLMIPETEGCITPILIPELQFLQLSAGDSSSRARLSAVYPPDIKELVLQLHQLLQQESFTKDSFTDMAAILQRFEGRLLPIALGSVCSLLKRDFWQSWDEYEEAFSLRGVVLQYYNNPQEPSLLDLIGTRVQQDKEVDSIECELVAMDAEIARLQAKRELLSESLVTARNRAEETATQLDQERLKREERGQQYIELLANSARIEVKNNVRRLMLNDLNLALDALRL